jgi:hypothetical protein
VHLTTILFPDEISPLGYHYQQVYGHKKLDFEGSGHRRKIEGDIDGGEIVRIYSLHGI